MAKENVFEKEWVDERDKNNLEGLLEQFNLPPAVITFVRENKRLVQVGAVLLIIAVVSWSFYRSYRDNRVEAANTALSAALNTEPGQMMDALAAIEGLYSGTDAALWAEIKIAQEFAASGKNDEAEKKYNELLATLSSSSSLYPLLIYGAAQIEENGGNFPAALNYYRELKAIEGYQEIGFSGQARIHEIQGELNKALDTYTEHLSFIGGKGGVGQTALIEEKIARIKATK